MSLHTTSAQLPDPSRDPEDSVPGQPVPWLPNPLHEEMLPNAQPTLMQCEAIPSCPVARFLGAETDPTTAQPHDVVVGSSKVPPEPPFLQVK